MRILHINRNYISSKLHRLMVNHLNQYKDIENVVFAPIDSTESDEDVLSNENVFVNNCFNKYDRVIFDWKQRKIMAAVENHFNINQFDCIHAYTLFTDGNCAMNLSEKYGVPYIVAVRNTDVNDFFKKLPFLRKRGIRIMEKAYAICFLSESYRDKVFNLYVPDRLKNKLKRKSYIVPNGIDDFWLNNTYEVAREVHRPLRLIYAGRIDRNKNIETSIKVIKELERMGILSELNVVGEVYDRKIYRNILKQQAVQYHKAVTKEKLIHFYRKSDVFIMPSFTESFGLVYAEAMSQGLPVIYTRGEGFDNQFADGEVGYSVDPENSEEIAGAIIRIVEKYKQISKSAVEKSKKFNWNDISKYYRNLYISVCAKNGV